jgi:putative ABC transport system permease protein
MTTQTAPVRAHPGPEQANSIETRASWVQRFTSMARLAASMMFFDRLKLAGTLFGVVFAVVLGNFQAGTFIALLNKNRMFVDNAEADVWLTPPGTRQFQAGTPLTDAELNRARSTVGVEWAEPLLLKTAQIKLPNGGAEPVSLVGTRGPRYAGGPWNIVQGERSNLALPDSVFFEDAEREKFGGLNLGSLRELSGRKVQAVGFTWGLLPFAPAFAFADDKLARQISLEREDRHAFVLVGVKAGESVDEVAERLQLAMPQVKVMTRSQFMHETLVYIITGTQIGVSFGLSTFMGLLVGLITVALSMFSSVIDNMRQFGTLKAIGATNFDLALLLFVQAVIYGLVGSVIGLGMVSTMTQGMRNPQLTPIVPIPALGITVVLMVGVCLVASILALLRLRKLEPAMVFR